MIKYDVLNLPPRYWERVSKQGKTVLRKLLSKNPGQRLTLDEALGSQWVANSETCDVAVFSAMENVTTRMKSFKSKEKIMDLAIRLCFNYMTAENYEQIKHIFE
jgi:hypothetical protein